MYLAIDIGGTKTFVALLDSSGAIQQQLRIPTPKTYSVFISKLEDSVAYLSTNKFTAVCVGVPGRIDRKRGIGVGMGNLPWLNVPIYEDVSRITRTRKVVLENDAKLAGLSEAILVKDQYSKVLYITIGTGIGTALIADQEIVVLMQDAEGGKILLEYEGKLQEWEDFASGKAILKRYGKPASEITDEKSWHNISRGIALGLLDQIAILQPEAVIIGGGVGVYLEKFKAPLEKQLKHYETPLIPIPPILKAQRPEDAVIYGCYYHAKKTYGTAN
ncbi:MAG: ROK family protein [Candidatus Saccharimonadales bacterium]